MRNIIFLLIFILGIYYGLQPKRTTREEIRAYNLEQLDKLAESPEYNPTYQDIVEEIVRVFSPSGKKAVEWGLRCSFSESKWNAFALNNTNRNGTKDSGVFQVNSVHGYKQTQLFNYKENIKIAYQIYLKHGKRAWYGKGCY